MSGDEITWICSLKFSKATFYSFFIRIQCFYKAGIRPTASLYLGCSQISQLNYSVCCAAPC